MLVIFISQLRHAQLFARTIGEPGALRLTSQRRRQSRSTAGRGPVSGSVSEKQLRKPDAIYINMQKGPGDPVLDVFEFCAPSYYSLIAETTPEATVRPPSRIANLIPCSMATGVISSMSMVTWSPGMHISVPAGREMVPVTSVVLM